MTKKGALAAEIERYAGDEALLKQRGAAARERVETMFSKEAVVAQIVNMYEEVQGAE
jgi:glycosyltransferase involved in cell wall biosynthesis